MLWNTKGLRGSLALRVAPRRFNHISGPLHRRRLLWLRRRTHVIGASCWLPGPRRPTCTGGVFCCIFHFDVAVRLLGGFTLCSAALWRPRRRRLRVTVPHSDGLAQRKNEKVWFTGAGGRVSRTSMRYATVFGTSLDVSIGTRGKWHPRLVKLVHRLAGLPGGAGGARLGEEGKSPYAMAMNKYE